VGVIYVADEKVAAVQKKTKNEKKISNTYHLA